MKKTCKVVLAAVLFLSAIMVSRNMEARKYSNRAERIVAELHNPSSKYVLVAAHRGDWRNWPENSLPGFESAIEMGVDIIELDVHMTKDSVLVVCHDGTLDRTTSGKGRIIDHTLAEIKALHLRKGHGVIDDVNKVPTLEEALKLCKDRVVVNVDKGWNYYDQVLAISEKLGVTGQILIKGSASVEEVDKIMSAHDHNMMYMPVTNFDSKKGKALYAEYQSGNICPLAFEICWSKMRPDVASACSEVEEGHESKLWINSLWPSLNGGLDDDTAMKDPDAVYGKILKMGATIIQSDRPAFLISYLHKHHRHYSNR